MITDIQVEDYQALRDVRLKLGRFTVITGPTSSGKSALVRAMKLVAFNERGTRFIRHGAVTCKACLGFRSEALAVGIERGGRGRDVYRVARPGELPDEPSQVDSYTKLEGKVPPEVRQWLRLSELNFAGQLDMPFLLTEPGSHVARVLGELTNVTLVLDAAREANRRKLETGRELRRAETRLADLKDQARQFKGLKDRMAAAREAEERLASMSESRLRVDRLGALLNRHRIATGELELAQARLKQATLPSPDRMLELRARYRRLMELLGKYDSARTDLENAGDAAANWGAKQVALEQELHEVLVTAGRCPVCNQEVSVLWRDYRVTSSLCSR